VTDRSQDGARHLGAGADEQGEHEENLVAVGEVRGAAGRADFPGRRRVGQPIPAGGAERPLTLIRVGRSV